MTTAPRIAIFCLLLCATAQAQTAPRVKGRVTDFDGLTFHLVPDGGGAPIAVRLLPDTRFGTQERRPLATFRPGDFAGATVNTAPDGNLYAREAHLFPLQLRGSGEGRIGPDGGGSYVINGTVVASGEEGFTLSYQGAAMTGGICNGRAASGGAGCTAQVHVNVAAGTPVTALVFADRKMLLPGVIATVSLLTAKDGSHTTPGLILEKPVGHP